MISTYLSISPTFAQLSAWRSEVDRLADSDLMHKHTGIQCVGFLELFFFRSVDIQIIFKIIDTSPEEFVTIKFPGCMGDVPLVAWLRIGFILSMERMDFKQAIAYS